MRLASTTVLVVAGCVAMECHHTLPGRPDLSALTHARCSFLAVAAFLVTRRRSGSSGSSSSKEQPSKKAQDTRKRQINLEATTPHPLHTRRRLEPTGKAEGAPDAQGQPQRAPQGDDYRSAPPLPPGVKEPLGLAAAASPGREAPVQQSVAEVQQSQHGSRTAARSPRRPSHIAGAAETSSSTPAAGGAEQGSTSGAGDVEQGGAGSHASAPTAAKAQAEEGAKAAAAGAPRVTDMSANWRAKTEVSAAHQADSAQLAKVYLDMAAALERDGLNLPAIKAQQQYFSAVDTPTPRPLRYADFPTPLERGAVRLAVLLPPPDLAERTLSLVHRILNAMPAARKVHVTVPAAYHVTLFMTSQPSDPRPNPFEPDAALPPGHSIPGPTPEVLQRELDALRDLAASSPAPTLEVHSIAFATSGTLLLCLLDRSGTLAALRQRLRATFPGGPAKQSSIFHVTLARSLADEALPPGDAAAVAAACRAASAELAGQRFTPAALWYLPAPLHQGHVAEYEFTTVEGKRVPFQFGPAAPLLAGS